jgi:hypothetical protein
MVIVLWPASSWISLIDAPAIASHEFLRSEVSSGLRAKHFPNDFSFACVAPIVLVMRDELEHIIDQFRQSDDLAVAQFRKLPSGDYTVSVRPTHSVAALRLVMHLSYERSGCGAAAPEPGRS